MRMAPLPELDIDDFDHVDEQPLDEGQGDGPKKPYRSNTAQGTTAINEKSKQPKKPLTL